MAPQAAPEGDMGILRDLLEGQGVTGALDHSKIEGANSREARSADAQAARVATRAAEELRRSRVARQVAFPMLPGSLLTDPDSASCAPDAGAMRCSTHHCVRQRCACI